MVSKVECRIFDHGCQMATSSKMIIRLWQFISRWGWRLAWWWWWCSRWCRGKMFSNLESRLFLNKNGKTDIFWHKLTVYHQWMILHTGHLLSVLFLRSEWLEKVDLQWESNWSCNWWGDSAQPKAPTAPSLVTHSKKGRRHLMISQHSITPSARWDGQFHNSLSPPCLEEGMPGRVWLIQLAGLVTH